MRTRLVFVVIVLSVTGTALAWAHDGHGETVVIAGTIRALSEDGLDVEALERVSLQMRRVSIVTDAKTEYERDKERVSREAAQPVVGERVSLVVRSDHGKDGSIRWVALRIQLRAKPRDEGVR